jgi:hypothetical protein
VFASVAALLLGAALGWRGDDGQEGGAGLVEGKAGGDPTSEVEQRDREELEKSLGGGWVARIGEAATGAELEVLFVEIASLEDEGLRRSLDSLLAARWAEVAPFAGIQFLAGVDDGVDYTVGLMTEWARIDFEEMLAGIGAVQSKWRLRVLGDAAELLMGEDPELCWELMRRTRVMPTDFGHAEAWAEFARSRPDEFIALAVELAVEGANGEAQRHSNLRNPLSIAAAEMASRGEDEAIAWAESLPEEIRNNALNGVIAALIKVDPWAAREHLGLLKEVQTGPSSYAGSGKSSREKEIASALVDLGLREAMQRSHGGEMSGDVGKAIANRLETGALSIADLVGAIEGVEGMLESHMRPFLDWPLQGCSPARLQEIYEWAGEQSPDHTIDTVRSKALEQWINKEPARALAYLEDNAPVEERNGAIHAALSRLNVGGESVMELIGALPEDDRPSAVVRLFARVENAGLGDGTGGVTPGIHPRTYGEQLLLAPASEERSRATAQLAQMWVSSDPVAAMDWAASLPVGESETAVAWAAEVWAKYDPLTLSEHLVEMEPSTSRDGAVGALVEAVAAGEPDSAWRWAGEIVDPEARLAARAAAVREWRRLSRDEGLAAIEAADLPDDEQEALRAVMEQ